MSNMSPEQLAKKRELAAINRADTQAAMGARACEPSDCLLLKLGGNCPNIGAADCPPEAREKIDKAEIQEKLMDPSVNYVGADGGGGFFVQSNMPGQVVLAEKAKKFQTATIATAQSSAARSKATSAAKPVAERQNKWPPMAPEQILGGLAVAVFGGSSTASVKK